MAAVAASVESRAGASGSRRKPRLVFKGKKRRQIVRVLKSLRVLLAQDDREEIRAERFGYTAKTFGVSKQSAVTRAMKLVVARAVDALAQKTS